MDKLLNLNLIGGAMITPPPMLSGGPGVLPGSQMPPTSPASPVGIGAPITPPVNGVVGTANTANGTKKNNSGSGNKNDAKKNDAKKNDAKKNVAKKNDAKKNDAKKNEAKKNDAKKNDANNNNNNNNNNNIQNKFNELNNELRDRIKSLKLTTNNYVIAYWIIWFLIIITTLSSYITNPIRYSEKPTFFNLTHNIFYYYLFIVLLAILCYYAYTVSPRLPLIRGGEMYLKLIPFIIFFFSLMAINVSHEGVIKEDGSFSTPPNVIVKDENTMIAQFSLLIIGIIVICGLDIYKSAGSLNKIQSFHLERCFIPFIGLLIVIYLLYNAVNYRVKKYNLPSTWSK